jgi:NADPH:quinone reductase-like Zn-dependent oxidoreductase
MVANVGQVAGDTGPIDPALLGPARSIALSRPGVFRFMSDPVLYREGGLATFRQLQNGLKPTIGLVLPLEQAAQAHQRLESGQTTGSILLRP